MKRKRRSKRSHGSHSRSHDDKHETPHTSKMENTSKVENTPKRKNNSMKNFSKNYWAISSVILAVVVVILLIIILNKPATPQMTVVTSEEAGQLVLDFAKAQGLEAKLIDVEEENGLYKVDVTIKDQDVPVYITKDGESLVPSVIPLKTLMEQVKQQQQNASAASSTPTQTNIPKSKVPETELFVMSYCPYGTQAEKGLIPVIEEMGDDANIKIRFVHYTMHGEKEDIENIVQVCIREEQSDKYLTYLKEFLKASDTEAARKVAGIDEDALEECISSGKGDEYYAEDSALSQKYGVQGSPTLIINGVQAQYGRNSQSYLSGICDAYETAPSVCDATLDTTNPSPGFGYDSSPASSTAAAASCG